ncbi:unnamed protein product [Prunus armeniaca]
MVSNFHTVRLELFSTVYIFDFFQFNRLVKLLEDIMDDIRILIFMDTKKGCDQITRQLRMNGWSALSIHGDKSQVERDWVLSKFKANDCNRCCCSWSSMLGYFKEIDSPPPVRASFSFILF